MAIRFLQNVTARRPRGTQSRVLCLPRENALLEHLQLSAKSRNACARHIGEPHRRFAEDKLRLMRGVRLATRFELDIEPATAGAMRDMAAQVTAVSAERIADELRRILMHPRRAQGMRLMDELGLMEAILPEVMNCLPPLPI